MHAEAEANLSRYSFSRNPKLAVEAGRKGGSTKSRSAYSNDPCKLPGVNMRSAAGRRYRDITLALIAEYGDADTVRLRELAGLKFSLEQVQALVVRGDAPARVDLVRLSNLIARRETELRHRSAAAAVKDTRPLHERLMDAGRIAKPFGGPAGMPKGGKGRGRCCHPHRAHERRSARGWRRHPRRRG
jgi:general stress protein YciG